MTDLGLVQTFASGMPGSDGALVFPGTRPPTINLLRRSTTGGNRFTTEADIYAHVKAHVARVTAKYHRQFDIYEKVMGEKHGFDQRSEQATRSRIMAGQEPLTDFRHGTLWRGVIQIGTGPGKVQVTADFDTGSMDTIITPGLYNPAQSATARDTGDTFELSYGDGTGAKGRVLLDTFSVAGLEAKQVAFGNAIDSSLDASAAQAMVGMAPLVPFAMSALRRPGFFSTLVAQHAVPHKVFAFGLWPERARLDLGHTAREYHGKLSWTPVVKPKHGMWMASFNITGVKDEQVGMLDTGTTVIIGPAELVRGIFASTGMYVKEQDGQLFGVYKAQGPVPKVSIAVAGRTFVLSADALGYQQHGDLIISGLVGSPNIAGHWIIGDVFFQDAYVVFDAERKRIGVAPKTSASVEQPESSP
ncbi:hypothetical protein V8E36_009355 [Tilletia maclaganii]